MNLYRITLIGHRIINLHTPIEEKLYEILKEVSKTNSYIEIYIGRDGDFDILSASIIKRFQKYAENQNIQMILVLPYMKKNMEYYENYYNGIIIPEHTKNDHPKRAITMRNQWMVEKSNLLICYIEHKYGGAYATYQYAKKLGKKIIYLASNYENIMFE